MKTYTVPVFLGVRTESKAEAIEKALNIMEYAVEGDFDPEIYLYCDIGLEHEVIEQEEPE
jgi:hypothetical protein